MRGPINKIDRNMAAGIWTGAYLWFLKSSKSSTFAVEEISIMRQQAKAINSCNTRHRYPFYSPFLALYSTAIWLSLSFATNHIYTFLNDDRWSFRYNIMAKHDGQQPWLLHFRWSIWFCESNLPSSRRILHWQTHAKSFQLFEKAQGILWSAYFGIIFSWSLYACLCIQMYVNHRNRGRFHTRKAHKTYLFSLPVPHRWFYATRFKTEILTPIRYIVWMLFTAETFST